jgi:hypothetical protein
MILIEFHLFVPVAEISISAKAPERSALWNFNDFQTIRASNSYTLSLRYLNKIHNIYVLCLTDSLTQTVKLLGKFWIKTNRQNDSATEKSRVYINW